MRQIPTIAIACAALAAMTGAAYAGGDVYGPFPVTEKSYSGGKSDSTSYGGQMARHVLHDSLKKLAGQGDGKPNPGLKARMMAYFEGKDAGREIIAPVSKGSFKVKQSKVDDLSKNKNIAGKTYNGVVNGWPNSPTGSELVAFWIDKASSADKGFDPATGYDYPQLISKFILGAMAYNQSVDNYLDEKLAADNKPNNKPYKEGAHYTGKEHSWDEGFGYFGAPAHTLELTADQVYSIAKREAEAVAYADADRDGVVDLYREMVYGPAYYASSFDRSGKTDYLHTIARAFLEGRELIASAKGAALTDAQRATLRGHAATVEENWEKMLAETVFKYAGSVYKELKKLEVILDSNGDPGKTFRDYGKHWGELKGFSLALQTGRDNPGETAVKLNRLIGYGPPLLNSSVVVDVSASGDYVKGESSAMGEYMLHMLKVQRLMVDKFNVKARHNDVLSDMASLAAKIGSSGGAEND